MTSISDRIIAARLAFERRTQQRATTCILSMEDARQVRIFLNNNGLLDKSIEYLGNVYGMDILEGSHLTGEPEIL